VELVDTHCHLDWPAFDAEREAVVARARAAGVVRLITIGTDLASSRRAVALAEAFPEVYAAVGVHPNDSADFDAAALAELRALAAQPKVVAIGEIGLDYHWRKVAPARQAEALRAQLELAGELELPVVIHNREATDDVLAVLAGWAAGLPAGASRGVLHSFSADWPAAERALVLGFALGITGPITFKKADLLRAVAAATPAERLLVETDAPFLTPHPHRGERNEPAYVRHVAAGLAVARAEPLEAVARQTSANAARVFAGLELSG
jgi:TatD DNase family protein